MSELYESQMTVIVPVSPIKSHPSVEILEETVDSVRHHLPKAEVFLTFDGVRREQEDKRLVYELFIEKALWLADHKWKNTLPFIYEDHKHQSGMMKAVIGKVETPLLMYVEQDTPLVIQRSIDFRSIHALITSGKSDLVRLHHETRIPEEHDYLMHGAETVSYMRTSQWSQRPHVASTAFYRRILDSYFGPNDRAFIEDRMYGIVRNHYCDYGIFGWQQFRLHIATGAGNIQRSYHLDGRAGEKKYE